jgi:hypothetical protein
MASRTIGSCEALCASCARRDFEQTEINPELEEVVGTFPVSEALDWMDEIDFTDSNTYQEDFKRIGGQLDISAEQAASIVKCAVMRVRGTCENLLV